jgi:uncharacterized membrane protein YccC
MTAFLADVRDTIWQPDAKHGPLPRVLLSMTLVPDLTTTVLTLTITGIAADSKLAGGPGSKAGRRLVAVATMLAGAIVGAALVLHAPIFYPLAAAFVVIVLGAATTRVRGRPDPAWVRSSR